MSELGLCLCIPSEWAGFVVRIREKKNSYQISVVSLNGTARLEDVGVSGRVILKLIF